MRQRGVRHRERWGETQRDGETERDRKKEVEEKEITQHYLPNFIIPSQPHRKQLN